MGGNVSSNVTTAHKALAELPWFSLGTDKTNESLDL